MLTILIASRPRESGSTSGVVASVVIHSALIAMAVVGTARGVMRAPDVRDVPPLVYFPPAPATRATAPTPTHATQATTRAIASAADDAPPVIRGPLPPPVPATVQATGPVADVNVALPNIGGVTSLTSQSGGAAPGPADAGAGEASPLTDSQVERAVQPIHPVAPRYPEALRAAGVTGIVRVRFVVDAEGRVEAESITIFEPTQEAFADAVRRALLSTRYRPAEANGQRVRQLVEQAFTFRLQR